LSGHEDLYSLEGQIQHKFAFLRDNVKDETEVTMIGHSMGCKIILETMKLTDKHTKLQVKGFMLFPMIERMYELPSGKSSWIMAHYFRWFVCSVAWIIDTLPYSLKKLIVEMAQACDDMPSKKAIMDLVNPARVKNALHLAWHEILEIKELDVEAIERFKDRLWFFYGQKDAWAPVSFHKNLAECVPGVRAVLDASEDPIPHAFVLWKNDEVADVVTRWHATTVQ